jgi:hypothetical protein
MARVALSDGWAAGGNASALQPSLRAFLKRRRMWVIGEQPGEVHVRQGWSFLTRLFGGRLALPRWLAKRAVVKLSSTKEGVAVRASIEESSPAAELSPRLRAKYRGYFDRWMADLKAHIR